MKKFISALLVITMLVFTVLPCFAGENTCPGYGDVNLKDGKFANDGVDVSDARLVLRNAINLEKFTDEQKTRADIDGNGVSVSDARMVLRIAIKLDSAPDHPVTVAGKNNGKPEDANSEYNLLKGTNYVISAKLSENGGAQTAMKIARNGQDVYVETALTAADLDLDDDTEGLLGAIFPLEFGLMIKSGKTYMVTKDHKYSLEYTKDVMTELGMTEKDLKEMTDPSQYTLTYPELSIADKVETQTIVCPVCGAETPGVSVYTFNDAKGGKLEVYMNGSELLKTVDYDRNGKETACIEFDYVSADVPASYFALPSSKLNQYPTKLQTPIMAVLSFFGKVLDMDISGLAKLLK